MRALDVPAPRPAAPQVVVPVQRLDRSVLSALAYARSISSDVTAVWVTSDAGEADRMREQWRARDDGIPLVIINSPRRRLISPLLAYLDERERRDVGRPVAVVLSEVLPRRRWGFLLHDATALLLKLRLFLRPNTVVVDIPYHL